MWLWPGSWPFDPNNTNPNYGERIIDTPNWKALPYGVPLFNRATGWVRGGYSQNWDPGNMGRNYPTALKQAGNSFGNALQENYEIMGQGGSIRLLGTQITDNGLSWIQTGAFGVSSEFRWGHYYLEPFRPYDPEDYEFELLYTNSFKHNVKRDMQWDKAVAIIKLAVELYIKWKLDQITE